MSQLLFSFLNQVVLTGTLEVEAANGNRVVIGNGKGQRRGIRFHDRNAERRLILNPELAFGELYSEGRMSVSNGTIYDVIELISKNLALRHPPGIAQVLARFRNLTRRLSRNSRIRAKRNVAHHYDLDRQIYDLFLDEDRQYSCAYFENSCQGLEQAQYAKKNHIAAKLLLEPGQRVLDIGSGWGGLALHLATHCEVDVTGITLSEEQLAFSRQQTAELSSVQKVQFDLCDYRAVADTFDRIVSVGMFEHVGVAEYDAFFRIMAKRLSDDGVMLLHSIGRVDGPGATNPWLEKYIFPGGYAPALSEVLPSIEKAGFIVTDVEILRLHYAETLRRWRERFLDRRGEAVALTDEQFYRMWEFYLAACECAFRYGGLMVFQIQLAKQIDAVPITRNYISEREAELKSMQAGRHPVSVAAE